MAQEIDTWEERCYVVKQFLSSSAVAATRWCATLWRLGQKRRKKVSQNECGQFGTYSNSYQLGADFPDLDFHNATLWGLSITCTHTGDALQENYSELRRPASPLPPASSIIGLLPSLVNLCPEEDVTFIIQIINFFSALEVELSLCSKAVCSTNILEKIVQGKSWHKHVEMSWRIASY